MVRIALRSRRAIIWFTCVSTTATPFISDDDRGIDDITKQIHPFGYFNELSVLSWGKGVFAKCFSSILNYSVFAILTKCLTFSNGVSLWSPWLRFKICPVFPPCSKTDLDGCCDVGRASRLGEYRCQHFPEKRWYHLCSRFWLSPRLTHFPTCSVHPPHSDALNRDRSTLLQTVCVVFLEFTSVKIRW